MIKIILAGFMFVMFALNMLMETVGSRLITCIGVCVATFLITALLATEEE